MASAVAPKWSKPEPEPVRTAICSYCGHGGAWDCDCAGKIRGHQVKHLEHGAMLCLMTNRAPLVNLPQPRGTGTRYAHRHCIAKANG